MKVLVVENNQTLRRIWVWHLVRQGLQVVHVGSHEAAIDHLSENDVNLIVVNLEMESNGAFAIADYASYRRPDTRVIFVTRSSFFSDGSIFNHCQNACAVVPSSTAPSDLAAMARHYSTS